MKIYLIRHGKTEANEKRLYCGKTDIPLSSKGKENLKPFLEVTDDTRFISSGLKRCNETLEILFGDVLYEIIPEFQEMNFGAFEMQSYEQLKNDPNYNAWITGNNEANTTPGGESGKQMTVRVLAAFQSVLESEKNTVIVTHGGVIAAIMAHLFPNETKYRYEWQPQPGCGYEIYDGYYRTIPKNTTF